MANIDDVEKFVSQMMHDQAREDEKRSVKFLADAGWVAAEIEHWKQRCWDLEVELECMRNAFPEHDHDVSPKRTGGSFHEH